MTLPDQKAILFYIGLFPAFVDMAGLTLLDIVLMAVLAAVAIASSKLACACFANHMRIRFSSSALFRYLYYIAGTKDRDIFNTQYAEFF